MTDSRRGLILINTGDGKGKTTAALGMALRAVGNGMRVLMIQFLKGSQRSGELKAAEAFGERFIIRQMGRGFVKVVARRPRRRRSGWWRRPGPRRTRRSARASGI